MRLLELLEENWESGMKMGMESGMEKGMETMRRQTAERLLRRGADLDVIMDVTNYSQEEIKELGQSSQVYA